MKKRLIVVLIVMALIFVSGCGKSGDSSGGGSDSGEESSEENSGDSEGEGLGEDGSSGKPYYSPEAGMSIPASKTYAENSDKVYLYGGGGEAEEGLYYLEFYLYPAARDELEKMSDEEYMEVEENVINVLNVFRVLNSEWTKEDLEKWCTWIAGIEEGSLQEYDKDDGDYTVYYTMDKEYSDEIPEELKPIYDGIIADFENGLKNLELTEPISIDEAISGLSIDFESTDFEGNAVKSSDVFAKNKYTMVNLWASWCGPCVQELPELEKLNKEFEEKGCGIVGILTDGTDPAGLEDAKEIVAETGVTYLNIIDNSGIADLLHVTGVPTTVFVNQNGEIVGRSVVGANVEEYKVIMSELLGE